MKQQPISGGCRPQEANWVPVIDRGRCEGKQTCVNVCPYDVLETRDLSDADKQQMSMFTRLKARLHGDSQAFVVRERWKMNQVESSSCCPAPPPEPPATAAAAQAHRVQALEAENARLLVLVAELLIRNQELRRRNSSQDPGSPPNSR